MARHTVKDPGWFTALTRHETGRRLPPERAARRVEAFAYGNILVLSVIVVSDAHAVENRLAAWLVLGTTVSTFVAHIFAEWLSHGVITRREGETTGPTDTLKLKTVLRDSMPIITSGTLPFAVLLIGSFDVIALFDPPGAQLCAAGIVIFRIAVLGLVVERLQTTKVSWRTIGSGIGVAVLATVITIVKVVLTH
ncbi:hypothetical protein DFJ75_4289 [Williamsia muralis]|uniref:Uncharacterized protein n=1 Tax=Williamsia marianensis TaxID=85044 RepID=A0A315S5F9_WILMA|nr:hypothetical protein C7458_105370 [Williamsia marianensis]RKR97418.1 hypothetical protein DFJ75_4289 [Williamsia muralis]